MLATLKILWNSLKMALQELRVNKVRTFLSLLGITIGIFCIIAVFAATESLENNVRKEVASLGSNVIYIQKWPWGGGPDMPWWKYVNRPEPTYKEMKPLQEKVNSAQAVAFVFSTSGKKVEYGTDYMENIDLLAVTQDFEQIQSLDIVGGRFFSPTETTGSTNVAILGGNIWQGLFSSAEEAIGKTIRFSGRGVRIVGVLKLKGDGVLGGLNFDNSVLMPYSFARTIVDERRFADPYIMVKAKDGVSVQRLKDDLTGTMRAVRRLRPAQEDDFSLNEITTINSELDSLFKTLNIGGLVIGIFSLLVGSFGIANIMFVTVKERTNIIGLKKAIGAKRSIILMEFLMESVMLCIFGGLFGLLLVYGIAVLASAIMGFAFTLSVAKITLGVSISVIVGIVAGFIPAWSASKLDAVVAIRSN